MRTEEQKGDGEMRTEDSLTEGLDWQRLRLTEQGNGGADYEIRRDLPDGQEKEPPAGPKGLVSLTKPGGKATPPKIDPELTVSVVPPVTPARNPAPLNAEPKPSRSVVLPPVTPQREDMTPRVVPDPTANEKSSVAPQWRDVTPRVVPEPTVSVAPPLPAQEWKNRQPKAAPPYAARPTPPVKLTKAPVKKEAVETATVKTGSVVRKGLLIGAVVGVLVLAAVLLILLLPRDGDTGGAAGTSGEQSGTQRHTGPETWGNSGESETDAGTTETDAGTTETDAGTTGTDAGAGNEALEAWIGTISVGEVVSFGHYEQDGNKANGTEPIRWIVLDKQGSRVLLLSQQCLEGMPFHADGGTVVWKDSSLRGWLNNEFLRAAFSEGEKALIRTGTLSNPLNESYGTGDTAATNDAVFLLSNAEYQKYFRSEANARASLTAYAEQQGAEIIKDNGGSWWWLRTSGKNLSYAAYVSSGGSMSEDGSWISYEKAGVRPSLWADLSALSEPESLVKTDLSVSLSEAKPGDYVRFGRYEQDGDLSDGFEDLEWIVLAQEDGKVLLLSRYCIDSHPFHQTYEDIGWSGSDLRAWLNSGFMNNAFSFEEQSRLVMTPCDAGSVWAAYNSSTVDKIFLLSPDEVKQYLPAEADRLVISTPYAVSQGVYVKEESGYTWWWLRVSGRDRVHAAYVYSYGPIDTNGDKVTVVEGGVRPAIWVKYS